MLEIMALHGRFFALDIRFTAHQYSGPCLQPRGPALEFRGRRAMTAEFQQAVEVSEWSREPDSTRRASRFGRTQCARRVRREAANQIRCTVLPYRGFDKTRQRFGRTKCAPQG